MKTFRTATAKIGAVAALAMVSPLALAAGESTDIVASFAANKTEVLLIIVAFAVVLWAKRGGKLLNP